ncbi:TetR/AcrR family transcriptional regulator [Cumulibacter soli]|uniref:TetR/AcrR family transcriptional regulator n=1 Tax=Cumulibacter soli TaxID=2546344 RepID=UPI001067ED32|nr:TetR/AcrR family transcriptional regulator [Cumulibacter soli]
MTEKPRSIWLRSERSGRGPVPEYGRTQIASAAIEIADESGLEAVSTRKVAARIGASATSLYRYVSSRDELLELMLDTSCATLDLTAPLIGDWRRDLIELAEQLRGLYRRHRWLLDLAQGQPSLTPNVVLLMERALAAMAPLDVPGGTKLEAFAIMNGIVASVTRLEISSGQSNQAWQKAQVEFLASAVSDGEHPHLSAAFASPAVEGDADMLHRVLPRVLAGVLGID